MGQNRFFAKNIVCAPKKTTKLASASVSAATLYYIKIFCMLSYFFTLPPLLEILMWLEIKGEIHLNCFFGW